MSWRLKSHTQAPPGGYPYEQREGIQRKFKTTYDIAVDAKAVADFRQGNNLPRATLAECMEDIDLQTCQRLGNMPRWCYDTEQSYVATTPKLRPKSCSGCGAKVE